MAGKDAVIVGYDAISPLGSDLDQQWHRALAGKSGIGPLTRFVQPENFPVHIAGQVPDIDGQDYPFLSTRHIIDPVNPPDPVLAFWPLWPRVDVPPWPEPMPRPILFLLLTAPLFGCKLLKSMKASFC